MFHITGDNHIREKRLIAECDGVLDRVKVVHIARL